MPKLGEYKHGHSLGGGSRAYHSWAAMKQRCLQKNSVGYRHYGGRGITICQQWLEFTGFLSDMGEPPSESHSLDRIDVNGNYEPGNCRWATSEEQANNTRRNIRVTFRGETRTLREWAKTLGVSYSAIRQRQYHHPEMPVELLLLAPSTSLAAFNAATKPACKHGHAFTPENTVIKKSGRRVCRTCERKASREWHRARRAAMKGAA